MRKIVIVAPVHVWDDVRVHKKMALSLKEHGFDVFQISRISIPTNVEGVKILPPKGNSESRMMRFLSLPLVALQALKLNGDIYHLHNPDTIPIAWFLRMFGKKVIYDTHEDFTLRILSREWVPKLLRRVIASTVGKMEVMNSRICNASIATQVEVVKRLGGKCILIANSPRVSDSLYKKVLGLSQNIKKDNCCFRVIYIGYISNHRGLHEMVKAMEVVNERIKCRLWLIGPAESKDIDAASKLKGWEYIDYRDRMLQENAFAYLVKSDVGIIYIRDVGGHSRSDPNKIYEYMSFSKPFIASNFIQWREKLGRLGAGVFIQPYSHLKLAESILDLADKRGLVEKMGRNGKNYTLDNNWDIEFEKLLNLYKKIN